MTTYRVADLFCGAGGSTSGAYRAAEAMGVDLDLCAVNHWDKAIATHSANHLNARHYCVNLDAARPEDIVPEGYLDLLMASPECIGHSRARGGKPTSDQQRMSAWHVQRWASTLNIRCILVENVPEFRDWAPVDNAGKPIKSKRGQTFEAWIQALWGMGYQVEWRLLNAADFGDATTRTRFFLQARKDGKPIVWPEPSHRRNGGTLFGAAQPWRAAREILDWDKPGQSLLTRKVPLSENTRLRIARGLVMFGGSFAPAYLNLLDLPADKLGPLLDQVREGPPQPFVLANRAHNVAKGCDEPLPCLTTANGGGLLAVDPLARPFVLGQHGGSVARSVGEPLPTIATDGAIAMVQPMVMSYYKHGNARLVEDPLPTITTKDRFGLCEPMIVPYGPKAEARAVSEPLHTIMTRDRLAVCEPIATPFIVPNFGEAPGQAPRCHSVENPLPTVTSRGAGNLVVPILAPLAGEIDPRRIVEFHGNLYVLEILYRMLMWSELARAMGFGDEYVFSGTQGDVTKMVGNAVSVATAAALVTAVLG